ncbi:MAG: rod-binding protein [Micavibrio aeruginosavorus]|uniref:Rod-binding protein n=1 Tax=Micavibrio aeruginosavorus TaxID=349221 RepID=A0A7T5UGZ7_9BACT|nr:MAG: rod-binding protein [Micavibrio aeruginosavorus]
MNDLSIMTSTPHLEIKTSNAGLFRKLQEPRTTRVPPQDYSGLDIKNLEQIEAKARDFEAVYLAEMMKPLFESVEVDPLFGGGKAEEIYRGMMVQEYGKKIAETNSIGLADFVKGELIRIQQEAQDGKQ